MQTERSILVTVLVLLLVGSIIVQPMGAGIGVEVSMYFEKADDLVVDMDYAVSRSGYAKSIGVGLFPVDVNRTDEVYLYIDEYGVNGSMYPRVLGLYDHLKADIDALDSDVRLSTVDFEELDSVFEGPNATVIIPSQPSNNTDFGIKALEWVKKGGVLIAIGNRSVPFFADYTNEQWSGPDEFMNIRYEPLSFMGGEGMHASPVAEALGLRTVAPTMALSVDDVLSHGGQMIGYLYDREEDLTSHALFRIGDGVLIAMGGHIAYPFVTTAEDAVSTDIIRIILTGLAWISGPIKYERIDAGPGQVRGSIMTTIADTRFVSIFVFEMDNHQRLFFSRIVDT